MMAAIGLTLFLLSSLVPLQQQRQQMMAYRHNRNRYQIYDDEEYISSSGSGRYHQMDGMFDHQMEANRTFQMFISVSSLLGYLLLIYSLLAYRQMRSSARQMILMASSTV